MTAINDPVHCLSDGGSHIFGRIVHLFALGDILYSVIMTAATILVTRAEDEYGIVVDGRPAPYGFWSPMDDQRSESDK